MSIVEPIPDVQYGKGDWQDYINNWREKDAEWLQERTILRYATAGARDTDWSTPRAGHVTYNGAVDRLEMYSSLRSSWVGILMFQNLTSVKDDATGVNISHVNAGGKGATFGPSSIVIDLATSMMGGLFTVDSTAVGIQSSGMKKALLTTDSDELLSDTPFVAPGLRISGSGTIDATGKNVTVGALTAASLGVSNINMSGTLTGGVLTGTRGTFNGVDIGYDATRAQAAANMLFASAGLVSGGAIFYGDSATAIMRPRTAADGTLGTNYIQVGANTNFGPTNSAASVYMYPYLRIMQGRGVPWHNAAGTHVAWIAPTIYSGSDPGAANFPDGTIWCS